MMGHKPSYRSNSSMKKIVVDPTYYSIKDLLLAVLKKVFKKG